LIAVSWENDILRMEEGMGDETFTRSERHGEKQVGWSRRAPYRRRRNDDGGRL
jgi:hypothetical protein